MKNWVPDVVKNLNIKIFNLISRTNETRFIEWHECWNKNKCRCECNELIDKGVCDKGFTWNPSNCECGCDKVCDVGEYLDYEHCKCRKKLIDKLADECTETVEEVELARITYAENENNYERSFCTVYIVLMVVFLAIFTGITIYFVYCNWPLIKYNVSCIKFGFYKETNIW